MSRKPISKAIRITKRDTDTTTVKNLGDDFLILFPAIDIRNGKCVRLTQGDYNKEKVYHDSPLEVSKNWQQQGAAYLHVVDLDGAKAGSSINQSVIKSIAKAINIPIQVGGGIRSLKTIDDYITAGIHRVIIGTAAIENKQFLHEAVSLYRSRIAVSIDARHGYIATNGWQNTSKVRASELIKELEQIGVETIIYTDILKDGMLQGPNFTELETVNETTSLDVIASGGISSEQDIATLKSMHIYGAIIGKALYDHKISLTSLLQKR